MKSGYILATATAAVLMLSSCSAQRSPLPYFTNIESTPQSVSIPDYLPKIQPSDELFISINSQDPEATAPYNLPLTNPATNERLGLSNSPQSQTYTVDSHGDITVPAIGKIHVAGMTVEQLTEYIERRVSQEVENPVVRVEMMNFTVNVGGEVKTPMQVPVKGRRFSVLDALAAAGDMTEYGERDNVLVIREENGKRTYGRLNLNDAESLNSPYFYLKQNDFVYVEPNKIRVANSKYNTNNSFKLSVISTIVSGCSVITSLIIALTR